MKILLHVLMFFLISYPVVGKEREDYYKRMGVRKTASKKEIKKAFRELALKYHPDKNKDPDAVERFEKITAAYEVLSDENKRREYDLGGAGLNIKSGEGATESTFTFTSSSSHEQQINFPDFSTLFMTMREKTGGKSGDFQNIFSQNAQSNTQNKRNFRGRGRNEEFYNRENKERRAEDLSKLFSGSPVREYNSTTDEELVKNSKSGTPSLIYFWRTQDVGSIKAARTFLNVCLKLGNIANFMSINCQKNLSLCGQYGVRETPQIVYLGNYKSRRNIGRYIGNIEKESEIINFILDQIGDREIRVIGEEIYQDLLNTYSERPKIVLFTNKSVIPQMFKVLALQYKIHFDFQICLGTIISQLPSSLQVSKLPTLYIKYKNHIQKYPGAVTQADISIFLTQLVLNIPQFTHTTQYLHRIEENTYRTGNKCNGKDSAMLCGILVIKTANMEEKLKEYNRIRESFLQEDIRFCYIYLSDLDKMNWSIKEEGFYIFRPKRGKYYKSLGVMTSVENTIQEALAGNLKFRNQLD